MALIVVLVLLLVASILAVAGMAQAIVDERIAGNQRQVTEAFTAAEAGLLRAAAWWDDSSGGERHDQLHWNDPEGAIAALHAQDRVLRPGVTWSIQELHFEGDEVLIVSRGQVEGSGTVREVSARYRRAMPLAPDGLAPIVLGGPVADFVLREDAVLRVPAGDGDAPGPAILTASEADAEQVRAALSRDELSLLAGGVEPVGAEGDFPTPVLLQALVEAIAESVDTQDGPVPWDLGTVEAPTVNIIRGSDGGRADLHVSGPVSGAGILIVTGSLHFEQAPDFTGMILVLGGALEVGAGSGSVRGAVMLHAIEAAGSGTWVASPDGTGLALGGELALERSAEAMALVWSLLSPEARAVWEGIAGAPRTTASGRLFGWSERLGL
ncbi:PilX N-terminal domain-containing pilus assembly protein [Thioalkalivibrio sp.]|uniref:pilus assembly PilX family protein n=1 Tax=Thioalkalivibrio sp. TaxID=2093813 RepID=UPI0025D51F27|nr:PilX N-terminal domain-containing pilus assembly protein [Thioalkalivibrio sp.]